jgi:hypothetical protein
VESLQLRVSSRYSWNPSVLGKKCFLFSWGSQGTSPNPMKTVVSENCVIFQSPA